MRARRRVGFALIELLVVITITAVILGLCAGMIHLLLKLDRSGREALERSSDLARLARDFRADAHASARFEPIESSEDRLILGLDGGRTVEYRARPGDILRTVRDGDRARHFETYRRPARASVRYARDGDGPGSFLILTIDRPRDGRDDPSFRDYRIEAELGKARRLNLRPE